MCVYNLSIVVTDHRKERELKIKKNDFISIHSKELLDYIKWQSLAS